MNHIFTIGHSNQSLEEFLEMLNSQKITCVVDVRSIPYSKYTAQFNQENLLAFLKNHGILYAHFGKEFGARREDCLIERMVVKNGKQECRLQVDFLAGMKTSNFLNGVRRLQNAVSLGYNVTLMCSEANPLDCHRFSFLSRYLHNNDWCVSHIIRDSCGVILSLDHADLEKQMIKQYRQGKKPKLTKAIGEMSFDNPNPYTEQDQLEDAYIIKNDEIGYCPENIISNEFIN